jgi:hypothetical protein
MTKPANNFRTIGASVLACFYGAVMGVVSVFALLLAIFALGNGWGLLILPAALYGMPVAILAGAVLGWYVLRKRKHPLRRALWLVPLVAIPSTLLLGLVVGGGGMLASKLYDQSKEMRMVQANYSGHWIRSITTDDSSCQMDGTETERLETMDAETTMDPQPKYTGRQSADWDSAHTMMVTWWRPAQRGEPQSAGSVGTPTVMVQATAEIPRYRTPYNKVFVLDFLPDDRVRVEAYTAFNFDSPISQPADDQYVAQGIVVKCPDAYCCSAQ